MLYRNLGWKRRLNWNRTGDFTEPVQPGSLCGPASLQYWSPRASELGGRLQGLLKKAKALSFQKRPNGVWTVTSQEAEGQAWNKSSDQISPNLRFQKMCFSAKT